MTDPLVVSASRLAWAEDEIEFIEAKEADDRAGPNRLNVENYVEREVESAFDDLFEKLLKKVR